jgi:hypothetical protein
MVLGHRFIGAEGRFHGGVSVGFHRALGGTLIGGIWIEARRIRRVVVVRP